MGATKPDRVCGTEFADSRGLLFESCAVYRSVARNNFDQYC